MEPKSFRWPDVVAVACVVAIAILLRVTSLSESFWVDELHSAWCVWGSPEEVVSRSIMGHQSPVWFGGLWLWKQLVGESEFALRMLSVLAVAIGCGVLTWGVGSISRWYSGVAAGLTLAIEQNSLFFGTELRPYAAVVLFSSVATVCLTRLWPLRSRHDDPRAWTVLIISIAAGVLCQPTSAGVLLMMPLALIVRWLCLDRQSLVRLTRLDAGLVTLAIVVVAGLWMTTLGDSWRSRQTWAAFATANNRWQFWEAWDWVWLLIAPMTIGVFSPKHRSLLVAWSLIVVVSTGIYFASSYLGVIPIWHRRYFLAGLPILASIAGLSTASLGRAGPVVAIALLAGLVIHQGSLSGLRSQRMVVRGEDWRGALKMVEGQSGVFIDAGLIESTWLSGGGLDANQLAYLTFVASGPYRAGSNVTPIGPTLRQRDANWIVTRNPAHRIPASAFPSAKIHAFGGVSVIELPRAR